MPETRFLFAAACESHTYTLALPCSLLNDHHADWAARREDSALPQQP